MKAIIPSKKRPAPYDKWEDDEWFFENPVDGQHEKSSRIKWEMDLGDEESLLDETWEVLRNELKAFVWSAINDKNGIAVGRLGSLQISLREIASYVASEGLTSISEFDEEASWDFARYVQGTYGERNDKRGRPRKTSHSSMMRVLEVLPIWWRMKDHIEAMGYEALPERPFGGATPYQVVSEGMGLKRTGRLKSIPDSVAFPIMNAASSFLIEPADDVIRLQSEVLDALNNEHLKFGETADYHADQYAEARARILAFHFSCRQDENQPWRAPIQEEQDRVLIDGREVSLSALQSVRHAILTVVAAACTTIQSGTGMRAHEINGLRETNESPDSEPSCLSSRTSKDGLVECFYVKGVTAKRGPPREVEWLIGSRPAGSSYVPPTVRALRVLKVLLAPWRSLGGSDRLLVTFTNGRGLPRTAKSIGRFRACYLTYMQKEFVHEHVDLSALGPAEHSEFVLRKELRGHRWRTTFAQNMYQISSGLLPALQDHFKHLNDAITVTGYIGTDPGVIESCDSARTLLTARLLLKYSNPSTKLAGSIAKIVDRYRDELREMIEKQAGEALEEKAVNLVIDHDIQIWNSQHARCFMSLMPESAACHRESGVPAFLRTKPFLGLRSPELCAGCSCSSMDLDHLQFWEERLSRSVEILNAARRAGRSSLDELRVEVRREALARRIVEAIRRKTAEEFAHVAV